MNQIKTLLYQESDLGNLSLLLHKKMKKLLCNLAAIPAQQLPPMDFPLLGSQRMPTALHCYIVKLGWTAATVASWLVSVSAAVFVKNFAQISFFCPIPL